MKDFNEILSTAKEKCASKHAVIANAGDPHAMEFLVLMAENGFTPPLLTGVEATIRELLSQYGLNSDNYEIYDCFPEETAQKAVDFVNAGKADYLVKGMLETSDFLRPIVKRENNLRTDKAMSYLAFLSLPDYPKLLLCSDGGMIPYPDIEKKKQIAANAINAMRLLGYEMPKAAVLACKETVDPKMPETVDADALHQAALEGYFGNAIIDGPLSYDVCMSAEICAKKHAGYKYSGDYDILLFPNIHCANILVKSLVMHDHALSAGLIAGCKVPVVAPSRGCTAEELLLSASLAALLADRGE